MDTPAAIKKALIELIGANPNLPITATIVSIENDTCTIKLLSGLELSDVRLKATIADDADNFLITPKKGSEVMVMSQTGALSGLVVIKVDAVEKINYKKGTFEFEIDGTTGKVLLKKGSLNFGNLVTDFITEMKTAIITTPAGPGAMAPSTITKLTALDLKFKQLLNND
jgi:hypothetical protein